MRDGARPQMPKREKASGAQRHKARRLRLWKEQEGRCYWCHCLTVLPPGGRKPRRYRYAPNEATLDHLRDRLDPLRRTDPGGEQRHVMACNECNNRRGRLSVENQSIARVATTEHV